MLLYCISLKKPNPSASHCLCHKMSFDSTGLCSGQHGSLGSCVLQLCAAMQQGSLPAHCLQGSMGLQGHPGDSLPRICVLIPWEMAWMRLHRNSEMHWSECHALENQAVSQVFVLAFSLKWYGTNPCGCFTEILPLSLVAQRGTFSEGLLLRSWGALLLLLFLFQLVLCICLCTHGVCSGRWLWNHREGGGLGRQCWPNHHQYSLYL